MSRLTAQWNQLSRAAWDAAHGEAGGHAILRMEQVDRPVDEGVAHLLRQAHQVEEDRHRQRSAEGGGEFHFAGIDEIRPVSSELHLDLFLARHRAQGRGDRLLERFDRGLLRLAGFAVGESHAPNCSAR